MRTSLLPLLLAALAAMAPGFAVPADAATFTVTNTNTSGAGSLAQAITDANLTEADDVIEFGIVTFGLPTKTIGGTLPAITQPLTIDGYTQGNATPNTLLTGATDAVIRIELNAGSVGVGGAMLDVQAGPTVIRGLAISGIKTKTFGIRVGADVRGSDRATITGCFVGTDAAGTADSSSGTGILVLGDAFVGKQGAEFRNLLSGNNSFGLDIRGSSTLALNNLVGTNAAGEPVLGNGTGISVSSAATNGIVIGATGVAAGNVIAGNAGDGIRVASNAAGDVRIRANSIHDNGGLGIDLGDDGVTENDDGDADTGANGLQNHPVLTFARTSGAEVYVEGYLNSSPGVHVVEFFASPAADDSGFGEGEIFLGDAEVSVPDDETSLSFFTTEFPVSHDPGEPLVVTATARSSATDATSEFSRAFAAVEGGAELVVTTVDDDGPGSLREAVETSNANADANTIVFDLPPLAGAIRPLTTLQLTEPVIIDGYTQGKSVPNTLAFGTNAKPGVVIDGSLAEDGTSGFIVAAEGCVIRGLVMHSFPEEAIRAPGGDGLRIEGNFIGTDATGTQDLGNARSGIATAGSALGMVIGGPLAAHRNLISGNGSHGIEATGNGATIFNNLIGTDASGTADLGNDADGVFTTADGTCVIGDDEPGLGNVIRASGRAGVAVAAGSGNPILGNSIFGSDRVGIDLDPSDAGAGVTANDADDADDGGNDRQNFPEFTVAVGSGSIEVTGTLDVPAITNEATYTIRVFASSACHESGHGEGETFLGAAEVVLSGGAEDFEFSLPVDVSEDAVFTTTATDEALGNTSEFSACFPPPVEPSVCGDATGDGDITAGDALVALNTGVGSAECELCRCDVNDNGGVTAPDALLLLRVAVGQQVTLECPACS